MNRFKIQFKSGDEKLGWFDLKQLEDDRVWRTAYFDERSDASSYARQWWPEDYASGDVRVMPESHQEDYDCYN